VAAEATGVSALAERYASALFDLADERRALDEVAGALLELRGMLAASADLSRLVRSPILSRAEQGKALAALAERAGFSPLIRDFLAVVAKNRRAFALPAVIAAYLPKLAARRGEVTAEVVAAEALSEGQRARLLEELQLGAGRRVALDIRVDPTLIGGIVVKLGSRMVDASIKGQLERLRLAMRSVP
jgi:F-type H+-transporting ATPase subunit delta